MSRVYEPQKPTVFSSGLLTTGFDGMRTAFRSKGWYCGDGIAPQVLCPYCRKMKEEVNA